MIDTYVYIHIPLRSRGYIETKLFARFSLYEAYITLTYRYIPNEIPSFCLHFSWLAHFSQIYQKGKQNYNLVTCQRKRTRAPMPQVAITKRTNTLQLFLGRFEASRQSWTRVYVSAKLFQVFLTAAVKCWKPASPKPHTPCTEPYRKPKQARVSHGLKCPQSPSFVAYQRTSLYICTYIDIRTHSCSLGSLFNSLSKVFKTKTKKKQIQKKNVKQ